MPTPAVDRLRQTAGRFLRTAGPPAKAVRDRVTREVGERLAKRRDTSVDVGHGADVAPPRPAAEPAPAPPAPRAPSGPNPASIAKNVAHERPRAQPPTTARRDPEAMPGGKLPPRRPRPA